MFLIINIYQIIFKNNSLPITETLKTYSILKIGSSANYNNHVNFQDQVVAPPIIFMFGGYPINKFNMSCDLKH